MTIPEVFRRAFRCRAHGQDIKLIITEGEETKAICNGCKEPIDVDEKLVEDIIAVVPCETSD